MSWGGRSAPQRFDNVTDIADIRDHTTVRPCAGSSPPHRSMEVGCPRPARNLRRIAHTETSASRNHNSPRRLLNECPQAIRSCQHVLRPAGRQNAPASGFNHVLERSLQIAGRIECAVKGDLQRSHQIHQPPHPALVYASIRLQYARHKAARSQLPGVIEVVFDQSELVVRVHEVAATRPEQDIHRQTALLDRDSLKLLTGSQPALAQSAAQLDPGRTALTRDEARIDVLGAKLEDDVPAHTRTSDISHQFLRRMTILCFCRQ